MRSKFCIATIFGVFFLLLPIFMNAQELELPDSFQRGNTYIRYRLTPDALSSQHLDRLSTSEDTTLTIERQNIYAIDAYFDLAPERLPAKPDADRPQIFEVKWTPEMLSQQRKFALRSHETTSSLNTLAAWWKFGKIALTLGYDGFHPPLTSLETSEERLLHGKLRLPLGETGFSLGASLGMYASSAVTWAKRTFDPRQFNLENLFNGTDAPVRAAYTTSAGQTDALSLSSLSSGQKNAVLGTVNVTGAVKGIDVFTELGFASGTQEQHGNIPAEDLMMANFYALGGAKYRVGQVTLGLEAGFESQVEEGSSDSLGFENDFLIDNLLEGDLQEDPAHDKVYATVSASMMPLERMSVEGAFSYIQPFQDGRTADIYGFEVDGAFRYSLTNYLKCLVKAGAASLIDSWENTQYKVINQIELTY